MLAGEGVIDKSDKQSLNPTNPSPVSFGYSTYHTMAQNTRAGSDFSAGSPRAPRAAAMGEYAFSTLVSTPFLRPFIGRCLGPGW